MIPPALQRDDLRFCLVRYSGQRYHKRGDPEERIASGKEPAETGWNQDDTKYRWNDPDFTRALTDGYNYGVRTGPGNLIVIDCDDPVAQHNVDAVLPPTFTVKTASKGLHHYYYQLDAPHDTWRIKDAAKRTLIDVQGVGTMVVGPGSSITQPDGTQKPYVVVRDLPITQLTWADIEALLTTALALKLPKTTTSLPMPTGLRDTLTDDIKRTVHIKDLLAHFGMDTSRNPGMCPLGHPSVGKMCCSYNERENLFYCFNCETGGDVFSLWMAAKHCSFTDAKEGLADFAGIRTVPGFAPPLDSDPNQDNHYLATAAYLHSVLPFCCDEAGYFWVWQPQKYCYLRTDDIGMLTLFKVHVRVPPKHNVISEWASYHRALQAVGREHLPEELAPEWVQYLDTLVNIYTGERRAATHHDLCTNPIPIEIGPHPDTPILDALFESWVGPAHVETIYEILAYCTYRGYPIHVLFALVGSGRNGKSTLLRLIRSFVGRDNVAATDLDLLAESRFESLKLHRKLVCEMGETGYAILEQTHRLKSLVGQDLISYEGKGKGAFMGENYAKVIMATNSLPSSADQSEGWYRRVVILDFPNEFEEGHDILQTVPKAELEALACRLVHTLPVLLARGSFTGQGSVTDREKHYVAVANPLPIYIDKYCDRSLTDTDFHIPFSEFMTKYLTWLKTQKRRRVQRKEIVAALMEEGYEVDRRQFGVDRTTFVIGLKWKEKVVVVEMGGDPGGVAGVAEKINVATRSISFCHIPDMEICKKLPHLPLSSGSDGGTQKNVAGVASVASVLEVDMNKSVVEYENGCQTCQIDTPTNGVTDYNSTLIKLREFCDTEKDGDTLRQFLYKEGFGEQQADDYIAHNLFLGNLIQPKPDRFKTL